MLEHGALGMILIRFLKRNLLERLNYAADQAGKTAEI